MSGDLAGLVSRLEAVTNRLEKVASKGGAGGGSGADDCEMCSCVVVVATEFNNNFVLCVTCHFYVYVHVYTCCFFSSVDTEIVDEFDKQVMFIFLSC